ncbi:MAG: SIS domain-containing protein [Chloroflexi bacterium]|jgi:glucosamine--fructose-6-phosphate aminotransferase (isomerizing)|nr:SIS domain-containing protein [Chloroflexota bacterium]
MSKNPVSEKGATYHEIMSQTEAWQGALTAVANQTQAIAELWRSGQYKNVVFTGCGSTYYLSLAAAALWQEFIQIPAKGVPAGELFLYPTATYGPAAPGRTLLVAISRSGTTTETVVAAQGFRAAGRGEVIVITNYGDTPLARAGNYVIAIPEGQEESVAQTRSFSSMYIAVTALVLTLAGREDLLAAMPNLPAIGNKLMESYAPAARTLGENLGLDRFYFLGSGPRYGLASEVNLKMKEMTLTHSEPFHFFEFRHGPMSMVTDSAAVIGLLSDEKWELESAVLTEMADLGGHTFALAEEKGDVCFHSGLPAAVRNVLYLPILQLMAFYRAKAKGLNPDRPANLTAVVQLDLENH